MEEKIQIEEEQSKTEKEEFELSDSEKEEFELSDSEKEMIKQEREIKQKTVDDANPTAFKIAALSDADYVQFLKQISGCERLLFSVLNTKNKLDKCRIEIAKGETEQVFSNGPWKGQTKTTEDLVGENIINQDILHEATEGIRQILNNIYFNHVNNKRLGDKVVYFGKEDYAKYVDKISKTLKEVGLGLFDERQKKILEV